MIRALGTTSRYAGEKGLARHRADLPPIKHKNISDIHMILFWLQMNVGVIKMI